MGMPCLYSSFKLHFLDFQVLLQLPFFRNQVALVERDHGIENIKLQPLAELSLYI